MMKHSSNIDVNTTSCLGTDSACLVYLLRHSNILIHEDQLPPYILPTELAREDAETVHSEIPGHTQTLGSTYTSLETAQTTTSNSYLVNCTQTSSGTKLH